MLARLRSCVSYANVMATIAVFVALGGGALHAARQQRGQQAAEERRGDAEEGGTGVQGPIGPSTVYFTSSTTAGAELTLPAGDYWIEGQCDLSNRNASAQPGLEILTSSQAGGIGSASATIPANGSSAASHDATAHFASQGTLDNGCTSNAGTGVLSNTLTAIRLASVTTQ
jgi:hypothetical protein